MTQIPADATHKAEFYGQVDYYCLTQDLHYNTVIDHPEECWQKYDIWRVWEKGQWVSPGSGWDPRMLQPLKNMSWEIFY